MRLKSLFEPFSAMPRCVFVCDRKIKKTEADCHTPPPITHIPLATIILMIHSQEPITHSAIKATFKSPVDKSYTISKHHSQRK